MENDTLLGLLPENTSSGTTDTSYDNSGIDPDIDIKEQKQEDKNSTSPLLMYAGAALLLYFFIFKKK
jgi:hypothetical protein